MTSVFLFRRRSSALHCIRRASRRADPKLMSYDDFFAMLDEQGKFESFDYDDETKKGIVGDFLPVLRGSGDPLEEHLEDILATAKLKEVRVYPKDEIMYVRVEVRFLTDMAAWSRPYQMLAAWDCFNNLKGYVFPVGKGRHHLPFSPLNGNMKHLSLNFLLVNKISILVLRIKITYSRNFKVKNKFLQNTYAK